MKLMISCRPDFKALSFTKHKCQTISNNKLFFPHCKEKTIESVAAGAQTKQ